MTVTVVNLTVSTTGEPGPPPPSPWIGVGIGLVVLAVAIVLVLRHARRPQRMPPRRRVRILVASLAGGAAYLAMLIPLYVYEARDIGALPGLGGFALMLAVHVLIFGALGVPLFGTADLLLDYFRPRRTRAWLALGPLAITAFIVGLLGATGWVRALATAPEGSTSGLILAALIGGLVWWAFLTAPTARVGHVFE